MPEQITTLDALVGKTIAKAVTLGTDGVSIGLIFADETYAYFSLAYWEGSPVVTSGEEPWSDEAKIGLGLTTQVELDRQRAEKKASEKARKLEHERREYERLKAKFEGEGAAK